MAEVVLPSLCNALSDERLSNDQVPAAALINGPAAQYCVFAFVGHSSLIDSLHRLSVLANHGKELPFSVLR